MSKGQTHKNGSKLNSDARFGILDEFPLKIWLSFQDTAYRFRARGILVWAIFINLPFFVIFQRSISQNLLFQKR